MKLTDRTRQDVSSYSNELWRVDWRKLGYSFCGIYVISPDNRWPCKIGISQNAAKRVIELQTACWKKLDVTEYRYVDNSNFARRVEKKVHELLKSDGLVMYGEWFDISPEKAIEVIEFSALSLGIEVLKDVPDYDPKVLKLLMKQTLKDMRRAKWADILQEGA